MLPTSEPAVLIAQAPAGTRDRLLTFLTRGAGAVRLFIPRAPRRSPKVFIEPLQGGELVFSPAAGRAFGRFRSFVPQRVWPGIRSDLVRTVHAVAVLEFVTASAADCEPQPELFALLVRTLNRIEADDRPGLARAGATLRLIVLAGFGPVLSSCVSCRVALEPGRAAAVDFSAGGALCKACRHTAPTGSQTASISPSAHGFMARTVNLPDTQSRRLRVSRAVEAEVIRLTDAFFEFSTGHRPRAGGLLTTLENSLKETSCTA